MSAGIPFKLRPRSGDGELSTDFACLMRGVDPTPPPVPQFRHDSYNECRFAGKVWRSGLPP